MYQTSLERLELVALTNRTKKLRRSACLGLVIAVLGCSKANGETADAPAPVPAAAEPLPTTAQGVLAGYEHVRALLASDQITAVSQPAKLLASAAGAVSRAKHGASDAVYGRIETAAATLAVADVKDPDAVRRQFGEVSRGIVELLAGNEALRAGRFVFECPMAQGYRKWVQTTAAINNPYMGSKMLECGATSTWAP